MMLTKMTETILTFLFYFVEEYTGFQIPHFSVKQPLEMQFQLDLASSDVQPSELQAAFFSGAALPLTFHVFAFLTTAI